MSNSRAKSSKNQSRRSRRSRLRLILTESECAELDRAVAESGAVFRSLIISEAIHAGLSRHGEFASRVGRRCRRVDVWLPRKVGEEVKQVAEKHKTTQQQLLRHFLIEYITNAPWKATETENGRVEEAMPT